MKVCAQVKNQVMQGDTCPIPIFVTIDGEVATPENIDAIKIGVGPFVDWWPNGGISSQKGIWLFPLTAERSARLPAGRNFVQARVTVGEYAVGTAVTEIFVGESVI